MTDAIAAIKDAIAALSSDCDLAVTKVRNEFANRIASHEQAIVLLGGKAGKPSKARPKRVAQPKANGAVKTKHERKARVDPNLAEDKDTIICSLDAPFGSDAIVNRTGLSKQRVAVLLRQLVESGVVRRTGKARSTVYSLAPDTGTFAEDAE